MVTIEIKKFIGSSNATSAEDGELIFKEIRSAFNGSSKVELDFKGVNRLISAFLNSAIGQLYGEFDWEYIKNNLSIENMMDQDVQLLSKVVQRAKEYYSNEPGFNKSIEDLLNE